MKYLLTLLFLSFLFQLSGQSGGEDCSTATVIPSIPYVGSGNTIGAVDDYFASCADYPNQGGANDLVYEYSNGPNQVYVDISLCEDVTDYDCQLYLYENSCTGNPVGCQEDGCQSPNYSAPYNSRLMAQLLQPNTTYYIVVDGYSSGSNGNYQLNVSETIGLNAPDSSNLPLVLIQTNGGEIVDEPKINVDFKIINNGPGAFNFPTDPANEYDGVAGVEIRGSYSATLPQKPFGIETRDSLGENNNVSLFNMPSENDWILIANYNDKTFLRNILAFDLFAKMGHYAPRTELCEVVVNDIYQGIYVFTEKIKRDKDRVDIAKLKVNENAGDSLTGGYIFKVDYWNSSNSWLSNYNNPNYPSDDVYYVYEYPDENDITIQQKNYIQSKVTAFENDLWGANFNDPINGYRQHIDVPSFIDYFIVNEFARNIDGFKKSRRFYKNKNSNDSLIYAGPVWDFDWAYKDHTSSMLNGSGWRHSFSGGSDVKPPGWYIRLIQDTTFANELACRYFDLRTTILDTTVLFNYIDSIGNALSSAQERHYIRWPILGINVGTPEIGSQPTSYVDEIIKFKGWITDRLIWLDNNMPGNCILTNISRTDKRKPYCAIYPNPSFDKLNIYVDEPIEYINVYDLSGRLIIDHLLMPQQLQILNVKSLTGMYLVVIKLKDGQVIQSKFISQ
ncbi:MAG: CotH kinase family protein [Saprospiraceae bacterium]|nr:CotH kinase family protein [Saprospiraceae bacterium]